MPFGQLGHVTEDPRVRRLVLRNPTSVRASVLIVPEDAVGPRAAALARLLEGSTASAGALGAMAPGSVLAAAVVAVATRAAAQRAPDPVAPADG